MMSKVQGNQSVEVSKLVTLERIRRRRNVLPETLIEQSLALEAEKRIARALGGQIRSSDLSDSEQRYVKQILALVESA